MTRDPVGGRGTGIVESLGRLDAGTILAIILVCGLALRIFIAAFFVPLSGLSNDIGAFAAWGQRMASLGPGGFYETGYFADYPPGYMYVLWLLGSIGSALAPIVGQDATGGLVKIPGILADIGVAWLLFLIARRWGHQLVDRVHFGVTPERLGLIAATIYLFNPGVVFDSAVWGQIDSVGTLVLMATIYALARGWTEVAALGAVVAMLIKFQFAFLIPIVLVVGLKRHLFGRSSDPEHAGRSDLLRVMTSLATGLVSVTLLILPFGMVIYAPLAGGAPGGLFGILPEADPSSLVGKLVEAANTYSGLSVNAFNMWRNPWSELGDNLGRWGDDQVLAFTIGSWSLTWQHVGTLLFAAVAIIALVCVARRDDMRGVLLASLLIAIAFFALPTRVHERYLFPALALAAPLVLSGRAWPWIYGGLSAVFFANIYWVYTDDWSFALPTIINPGVAGRPMPQDPLFTATIFTDAGIWAIGLLITVLLGLVAWRAIAYAWSPAPVEPAAHPAASEPGPAPSEQVCTATGYGLPRWLSVNPADAYLREPSRRLDRRDALIALALVAFALVFRLWRLDVPRAYHFDEVYHARSAMEFIGSWENDWNRDVYEWTHPMLAKYLIAAGITLVDPNQVADTHQLDEPASALAVAPRRAWLGHERSIAFAGSASSEVLATDAETGDEVARWEVGGPVAALGYDPEAATLLVGLADSGTVEVYELSGLLASPDGRAPPAGPSIETELPSIVEIVVPPETPAEPILLRGGTGLAVVDRETDTALSVVDGTYGGVAYVTDDEENGTDLVAATDPASGTVVFFDAATGEPLGDDLDSGSALSVDVGADLVGPMIAVGGGEDQLLVALTGDIEATHEHPATIGGVAVLDGDGSHSRCGGDPCLLDLVPMPGLGTLIGHENVANLVSVAGVTAAGQPQVWTIEPHFETRGDGSIGMAAFDATDLPAPPLAMAYDIATTAHADDDGRLLVSTDDAELVAIDTGSNSFGWRVAGVAFGSILVGLIYLLTATMFGRRRIAVLAAAFIAIDGMSYVMSRISMNDIFVAAFIAAAYLAFWQIWSGRWARSAWWVLPLVGVLIGLAAASKWVGFYALAGLWVLVLARSDLGRLLLVMLAALALVVGAIGAPWPFLLVMIGIMAVALAITWVRPLRIERREALSALTASAVVLTGLALAFIIGFDQVEGARDPRSAVEYLFGLLARGAQVGWPAWIMIGTGAALVLWRALASLRDPRSDARWFRPGEMGGFAWPWVGACLIIIPLVVYGLAYIPYLQFGHDWALPGGPGYGWSLDELHAQMFGYHFNLKAGHDSSSPWWSWPLMLKPTWFHGDSFDNDVLTAIYNGGNPILFWAGIPALAVCAVLAWTRRSMALVLIVVAFAFQFVPWIRIERAAFAYHYLTAVIFAMIAVAYCVDELLRRPAWRDLAIGYLVLVVVAGILIFPLGSAWPMPDWYINAARALPPWNFGFQFPDPPQGERAELLPLGGAKLILGMAAAVASGLFAMYGRAWWERRRARVTSTPTESMPGIG
jgi:predicted membrane-bound dolichyl-phosphate-mannose-protein mannosyltransferase